MKSELFEMDREIVRWKAVLESGGGMLPEDIDELESHLRDEIESLEKSGLKADEAFLVSVKRIGSAEGLSQEYFKVNGGRLWKHLFVPARATSRSSRLELFLAVAAAILAGFASQIPYLFGLTYSSEDSGILLHQSAFFLFPFAAAFFIWKRRLSSSIITVTALTLVVGFAVMNFFPFTEDGDTVILSSIHLLLLYAALFGVIHGSFQNRRLRGYADYLRFVGELLVYSVLIGLGAAVLAGLTAIIFESIGVSIGLLLQRHIFVGALFAIPIFAAYLVETKRSIIENIAPVLARIFVPLFSASALAFIVAMGITGTSPFVDRDLLISLDVFLLIVIAMVFYSISARPDDASNGFIDYANLSLLVVAGIVDLVALSAIVFRLASFGISANRVAALGENMLMIVHLTLLIGANVRYLLKRAEFKSVELWIVRFIPVYAIWFAVVILIFPILFRFR